MRFVGSSPVLPIQPASASRCLYWRPANHASTTGRWYLCWKNWISMLSSDLCTTIYFLFMAAASRIGTCTRYLSHTLQSFIKTLFTQQGMFSAPSLHCPLPLCPQAIPYAAIRMYILITRRMLQLFLTAGQTYLQPPDLIELAVRHKISRTRPYPVVSLPTSSEEWHRPSEAFAFPYFENRSLTDHRYKSLILRASLTHLNVIARSSFHQTSVSRSGPVNAPVENELYAIKDHANHYFLDRALVAFEKHENADKNLRSIREVMAEKWDNQLWSIWWWGNSEDKVRAKLERWRAAEEMA